MLMMQILFLLVKLLREMLLLQNHILHCVLLSTFALCTNIHIIKIMNVQSMVIFRILN